jgi:hypothetical protein
MSGREHKRGQALMLLAGLGGWLVFWLALVRLYAPGLAP